MEHELKQRLVGAVVITAIAAIFVPMLFDDPIDESGKLIAELKLPEQSVASLDTTENLPKNIDDIANLPATAANKPIEKEIPALSSNLDMERWFIQVGNFGQEENAVLLQNKIKQQGFPVTISKISGDAGLVYKVRIGPELDRERAEKMKEQIYKKNNIKGMVILEKQ